MQPWTEALLKRLSSGSVHAGLGSGFLGLVLYKETQGLRVVDS